MASVSWEGSPCWTTSRPPTIVSQLSWKSSRGKLPARAIRKSATTGKSKASRPAQPKVRSSDAAAGRLPPRGSFTDSVHDRLDVFDHPTHPRPAVKRRHRPKGRTEPDLRRTQRGGRQSLARSPHCERERESRQGKHQSDVPDRPVVLLTGQIPVRQGGRTRQRQTAAGRAQRAPRAGRDSASRGSVRLRAQPRAQRGSSSCRRPAGARRPRSRRARQPSRRVRRAEPSRATGRAGGTGRMGNSSCPAPGRRPC